MAVASRNALGPRPAPDPEAAAFLQFFGTLAANPSVRLISQDPLGGYIDLWVCLADEDEANEMAIYDALAAYHASDDVTTPVDLHLILASEPDDAFPSDLRPMFRRR